MRFNDKLYNEIFHADDDKEIPFGGGIVKPEKEDLKKEDPKPDDAEPVAKAVEPEPEPEPETVEPAPDPEPTEIK